MIKTGEPVIPLTIKEFNAIQDKLAAALDYELGKDVVEELSRGKQNCSTLKVTLTWIAETFRGVTCTEVWRLDENVRFRDGKSKTPIRYEIPGRAKGRCLAECLNAEYESNDRMQFLNDFESCIRAHLQWLNLKGKVRCQSLRKCKVNSSLMRVIAILWLTDTIVLKDFLSKMFKRWRKIDDPTGVYRRRMAIHQRSIEVGHDCQRLQSYLESIGVVKKQRAKVRSLIAQDFTRYPAKRRQRIQ